MQQNKELVKAIKFMARQKHKAIVEKSEKDNLFQDSRIFTNISKYIHKYIYP